MSFKLTAKQLEALAILAGVATHCMLFGGSRSGKTFAREPSAGTAACVALLMQFRI